MPFSVSFTSVPHTYSQELAMLTTVTGVVSIPSTRKNVKTFHLQQSKGHLLVGP